MHKEQLGPASRISYSKVKEILDIPNLIELQKSSYNWFWEEGLLEVFRDISPVTDYNGTLALEFIDFELDTEPKYSIAECKDRDATYAASLRVKIRLTNAETGEVLNDKIFMGDFPLMTETGSFVINGAERVIVSQLVRSPGIYYSQDYDKYGKSLISSTVIPNRGVWIEYETDSNNIFSARVDRTRKIPVTVLMRALGIGTNQEILDLFGEEPKLLDTLEKDSTTNYEEGLLEVYKKIRPGEPPTVDSAESLLNSMLYDPRRYDLARVGRYKFNKKLSFLNRVKGFELGEDAIDPTTGELLYTEGTTVTEEIAIELQNTGIPFVKVRCDDRVVKVLSNLVVDGSRYLQNYDISPAEIGLKESAYFPALLEVLEKIDSMDSKEERVNFLKGNIKKIMPKNITLEDILASMSYILGLDYGIGNFDDIDHLGNRRIRGVGELLQNQYRIGLSRMERVIRERMTIQDNENITPQALINIRPVTAAIKEFFGSSQLSQFMDQNNPLSELTNKRRLSALGPGGLSRDRAGMDVRDVHSSHYGRMCTIETPEGPNIGLINNLATFARINQYGFIEAPYLKIDKSGDKPVVTEDYVYLTADQEENYIIAQSNEPLDENRHFIHNKVSTRFGREISETNTSHVDLVDISPKQIVSIATALIPFLENDDVTRALMGSNMQRQAVPLLTTDSSIVGTGMEYRVAKDSGVTVVATADGTVERVTADDIIVRNDDGIREVYKLTKFKRSNHGTCINQRAIISKGDRVKEDQIIADGPATDNGELALGKNPLIGFMTWEGYNYEDAILLSEKLVEDDVYTSLHIEEYESEIRDTKLGPEEFTRELPNVSEEALKDLNEQGIIRIGAEVKPGDILVGKVTPKGETELTAEERLLRAIFGEKAREVRDTSLRVPHGESGIIIDVKKFCRKNGDELSPGVNELVRVYIAHKRKISVGDKMAGRHGNKGVISRILPVEDMPFLPNGRPLDIVLNPLGVPSRMNIGQVLEIHLGLAAKALGWKVSTPVFDGANEIDIMDTLDLANDYVNLEWKDFEKKWKNNIDDDIYQDLADNLEHRDEWKGVPITRDGKIKLRDGRTGEYFDNPVTVGYMHYLKLHHLVDEKIHARSTGPYSLVTQQPLGGKAQFGGQRFGEMEVWALEAYGASYTLQEILTVKSDDLVGRVKTYEAIVKGENIPEPCVPESFKVLLKEFQALGLDVKILREDQTEVKLSESAEEIDDLNIEIDDDDENRLPESFIRRESDEILNIDSVLDTGNNDDLDDNDESMDDIEFIDDEDDEDSLDLDDDLDEDDDLDISDEDDDL